MAKAKILRFEEDVLPKCDRDERHYDRKCDYCDYRIPLHQLDEIYRGKCFGFLEWECPECGYVNGVFIKVSPAVGSTATGTTGTLFDLTPSISFSFKANSTIP